MRIASVVLNNFVNDNRVYKVADTLTNAGHEVVVVALLKGNVPEREVYHGISVHRIRLRSLSLPDNNKFYGGLKFLEFFLKVMWNYRRFDVIHCNDFEGLIAGVMVKMSRPSVKLVYDSHEYQREKFGLNPFMKKVIGFMERLFIHWPARFITISPSIAAEYQRLDGIKHPYIGMNAPHREELITGNRELRDALGLDDSVPLFIYQGGFARSRGIEVLIESFQQERFAGWHIVFMGSGPLNDMIREAAEAHENIHLLPPVPYKNLMRWTSGATAGFVSTQNICLNNYYCMPNKLFEYIHAGIPVITNNLVECARVTNEESIGVVIGEYNPDGVWEAVDSLMKKDLAEIRKNLLRAREKYSWETQELVLLEAYSRLK
ncbi:MAG: glycosyltransferase [Flavobacteriales bacterium]